MYKTLLTIACSIALLLFVNIAHTQTITLDLQTNVDCNGNSTGAIDISVSGGTSPYTYSWSNTAVTEDISSLVANTYTVTVTDALLSTVTQSFTITQPAVLSTSNSLNNITCNGGNDGSILTTPSGGTSPYTFLWSVNTGSQVTQTATGLGVGTYTVTVTDFNGCTAVSSGTGVTEPAAITTSFNVTNASCNGGNNGAIDLTPGLGNPPYTYKWSNGPTTQDISGLIANTYTVTVTDDDGCTVTGSTTVTQPTAVSGSASINNVSCNGGNNGSINLTPSGGTPGYTFLWSNSAITEDISGLAVGTYTVTITDANLCTFVSTGFSTTSPTALSLSSTQVDVLCNGGNNGSIDLSVSGGVPAYNYAWDPNGETTQDISSKIAGTYTVTVTDDNGCTESHSATITQPTALIVNVVSQTNVSCNGGNDGSATAAGFGGTTPYSFAWSSGGNTATETGLSAGTYTVTITDANLCTNITTSTITEPTTLTVSTTKTDASCFGGIDGTVNSTPSGGTSPYTYKWSNGPTTQNITGPAATYTVTVTDANLCTALSSKTIGQPTIITLTTAVTDVSCNGGSDGAINLSVSGGTPGYTYDWSNGPITQDVTGLAAGTYTVTVTDANLCTMVISATVSEPTPLSTSTSVNNASCNGGGDGSIDLTVNGGTTPYSYIWNNSAVTQDISSLTAGTYFVTVTDANGCSIVTSATVSAPSSLSAPAATTHVSCNGGSNGAIDLTVSGGTPGYTYLWSNSAVTQDLTGITAGTYAVTVTDANGCTIVTSGIIIIQPSAIAPTTVVTDVSCNGGNDGAINLSVTGGTPGYTYKWSNGPITQDISSLSTGTYTVTITDSKGCTSITSATVNQPNSLSLSTSVTNVSCNSGVDGAIDLTVNGGTTPYTYAWSNSAVTQDLTGIAAGTYFVTVTDANNCSSITSAVVIQPTTLTSSITSQTNVSCNGGNNGSLTVTANGGTTPYGYAWSSGGNAATETGLSAGTYTVTVTDANNCTSTSTSIITQPVTLAASITSQTNVSCNGGSDGSLTVTATGGTTPYVYLWSNSGNTATINGLSAGPYSVTIMDANGCSTTASGTITEPTTLTSSITAQTDVSCNGGNDGSLTVTANGGTTPYVYNWNNFAVTATNTGLSAGSYSVTVTDANNCTSVTGATITQPTALSSSTSVTNVSCNGGNNGSINLTVSGGTTSYSYEWSNGPLTQDIFSLSAGTYTVTITDANGCTLVTSATVTEPTAISLSTTSTSTSCNSGNDGAINLSVSGGTPGYTYNWSNGPSTQDISGLSAGTYTVTVTDANNCTSVISETVSEPTAISLSTTVSDVSCNSGTDGAIDLTATGGTSPYTYKWSNGPTTQDISGLVPGTYTVTVTDANLCTSTTSATVTQPTALSLGTAITNVSCNGGSDGAINLFVTGGTSPYEYDWSNGETTEDINGLIADTYTVTVTDDNGCTAATTGSIISEPTPIAFSASITNTTCFGGNDGEIDLTVSGGTAPYNFVWNNSAVTEDITGLSAGNYTVTVTDDNGCTATYTDVVGQPTIITSGLVVTNITCNGNTDGEINLTVSGGNPGYTYEWSNGPLTQDINGLAAGTYTVTITDNSGCTITAQGTVVEPPVLTANTAVTQNVSCNGGDDGIINLTVIGGTSPYSYNWNNGETTEDIDSLIAGTYFVTITDNSGCTFVTTATAITQPTAINLSVSVTNSSCGGNDGAIDLTVSGGSPAYSYEWSNGATTQDIFLLNSATYTVTVTDNNGCTDTISGTVVQPVTISGTTTITHVLCNGGNNGAIDLEVTGGTSPYTYSWNNSEVTQDINTLTAGSYSVVITDDNGCTALVNATVNEPSAISLSFTPTGTSCTGGNDGTIDLTVSGGTSPYEYSWSTFATTQDINGLIANTYIVTVTDDNNCTAVDSVVVTEPTPISSSTIVTNTNCNGGSNGKIDLSVSGGTSPYTFDWNNSETTEDINGLSAGTYTVTITDDNNCTSITSATVGQPTALVANATATDASCNGGNDGTVDLTVSGGTPGYLYSWNNSATTQDLASVTAGTYTVTVTDSKGCAIVTSATVGQPTPIVITSTLTSISCNGNNDGSIDITVTGGTPGYTYLWNNSAVTEDISALIAGTYIVTVTDANGCTAVDSATVIEPAVITATLSDTSTSCNGGNDGSIDLTVSGGTSPYDYAWNTNATTQDLSGLFAGTYTVTITDDNNCTAIASVTVGQPTVIGTGTTLTDVSCNGGNDGEIDLFVAGGTAPYTFEWSNSEVTEDITGLSVGTYTVTVTDDNGCTTVTSATVVQPAIITASFVITDVSCNGGDDGDITLTANGGVSPYAYVWSNSKITSSIDTLTAGIYIVTITDINGCTAVDTATVNEPLLLVANITIDTLVSCNSGANGALTAGATGGTSPYSFVWSTNDSIASIDSLSAGIYTVTVTDDNGCTAVIQDTLDNPAINIANETFLACDSMISPSGNYVWTVTGVYNDTLFGGSNLGCDSIIIATVTVNTPTAFTFSDTACISYTSPSGNFVWDSSGTYMDTIPNTNGCDSVLTINLIIDSVNINVSQHIDTLMSEAIGAQYQWLNCDSGFVAIDGDTNQTFIPTINGNYAVEVTENGCTDTSLCINVTNVGMEQNIASISASIFPNPARDVLNIKVGEVTKESVYEVYGYSGQLVDRRRITKTVTNVDVSNYANGVYIVKVNQQAFRFVKH